MKFFVHYGAFAIQRISDHDELVGSDINLLHRLLKNSVTEETGFRAYALYSDPAIQQLSVDDFVCTMTLHKETYEHLGEIRTFVQDMHPVWDAKQSAAAVTFPNDSLLGREGVQINMPRERVWDYLVQPKFRSILIRLDRMEVTNRTHGRIAPGSVYACYHGNKWVPLTILEWQPFEYILTRESNDMFPDSSIIAEYRLASAEAGTFLSLSFARPTGPFIGRTFMRLLAPVFIRFFRKGLKSFKLEIEKDYLEHSQPLQRHAELAEEQIRHAAAQGFQKSSDSEGA